MTSPLPPNTPRQVGPPSVRRRLDEVVRRIRWLRILAGVGRVASLTVLALVAVYSVDRLLALPLGARAVVLLVTGGLLLRELWRRVLSPLLHGPRRLDAARLVEGVLDMDGRLVSALQLPEGEPGSFEHKLASEAEDLAQGTDLRRVLVARPSLKEAGRAAAAVAVLALTVVLARPHVDVFVQRWLLADVPWPRDTHLQLLVPERSTVHVLVDGTVVASRAGTISIQADWSGEKPDRVELVVEGADGDRTHGMGLGSGDRWIGHLVVRDGDTSLTVRGGDDDGSDHVLPLRVVDPPRLDDPVFRVAPPAYVGTAPEVVGSADLMVPEGTTITVMGRPSAPATSATLWLLGTGESVELTLSDGGQGVEGSFLATTSDTLSLVLGGEYGLATPDPGQHALLVHEDRPPALRVYAPARSDVKVTEDAVVPVALVVDDDHGVEQVLLRLGEEASGIALVSDGPTGSYRHVLDLAELGLTGSVAYELTASDRRELPGKGRQTTVAAGRRIDVVEAAELQRLLADRQLRLKEAFGAVRERQTLALAAVDDLVAEPPEADDPDLVAAAVSQNQVTTRLARETRELCVILEETILNRLDTGPGAETVLRRRLDDWRASPVDRTWDPPAFMALADDYAAGKYGRLDVVGRLLEMADVALDLSELTSPGAHDLLVDARNAPSEAALRSARDAQSAVLAGLDRLLERMDEWEDYQEVLDLVKTLIDDQRTLREASQRALTTGSGGN